MENKFNFNVGEDETPLDIIIELIKKKKMSILDISIKELTDSFVDYVDKKAETVSLEVYSEYAKMAAYLIELKTRYLLPNADTSLKALQSKDQEFNAFINQVLELQMYKKAAEKLLVYEDKRNKLFTKYSENYEDFLPDSNVVYKLPKYMNPEKLKNALDFLFARNLIKERMRNPVDFHMSKQEYTVSEVATDLIEIIQKQPKNKCLASEFFLLLPAEKKNASYFCLLFFVVLSLSHQRVLFIEDLHNHDFCFRLESDDFMNADKNEFIETIKQNMLGD